MNGYNRLAPFYDRLATVFVGKQLQQAQLALLPYLQQKRKLLILGGGTGWILSHIFKINPTLEIDYVDSAAQMIARARQRAGSNQRIRFIEGTEAAVPDKDYDAVITNFYLDLFTAQDLMVLIGLLRASVANGATWLVTDFEEHTGGQRMKVKLMYYFFWMATGLKTRALPPWYQILINAGLLPVESKSTRSRFIRTVAFQFKIK
ncbi:MAG: class I SAM-dependent methyltransferase [Cyclobacteriaceae bacterium]|nr:class I SAM-dependent methyltransferase [Cyclobacteriaceae bacterium]